MRVKGLEPPRETRQILSLVRLPIPPHPPMRSDTIPNEPGMCQSPRMPALYIRMTDASGEHYVTFWHSNAGKRWCKRFHPKVKGLLEMIVD